jgi:hypothetical protein
MFADVIDWWRLLELCQVTDACLMALAVRQQSWLETFY